MDNNVLLCETVTRTLRINSDIYCETFSFITAQQVNGVDSCLVTVHNQSSQQQISSKLESSKMY